MDERRPMILLLQLMQQWVERHRQIEEQAVRGEVKDLAAALELHRESMAGFLLWSFDRTTAPFASPEAVKAAREIFGTDDIEFDDVALQSETDESGTWIQGWVWLDNLEDRENDDGSDKDADG